MAHSIKTFFELLVPQYLLITAISTISAYLLTNEQTFNLPILILAILSLSLTMLGFNALNMVFDAKLDAINKPNRPIPSGKLKKSTVFLISISLYFSGIIISLFVNDTLPIIIVVFSGISFIYTYPKLGLRKNILTTPIIGGILYGIIPFLTGWSITNNDLPIEFIVFFTLLITGISIIKDIEDVEGERKNNLNSIPLKLGIRKTLILSISILIIATFWIIYFFIVKSIPEKFLFPIIISAGLIVYIGTLFKQYLKIQELEKPVTQSKLLTKLMMIIVVIQFIFGITNII